MIKHRFAAITLGAILGFLGYAGLFSGHALAAVTVTPFATVNVSSDSAGGSSVALPTVTLTEGAAGDIQAGSLTWALPTGYIFDATSPATVAYTGTGLSGTTTVSYPDGTHFSINITSSSTASSTLVISSLKVKAATGTPMAATGNLTLSAGTINGIASTTSFGSLTQVPGSASKLAFTLQPATSTKVNTTFGATVGVRDQFGNLVSTDNSRVVNLTVVPVNPTTSTTTLLGTTSVSTASGLASFTNLSYGQVATIKLQANASSLTSALSNQVVVTASSVPATSTEVTKIRILPNGILVKIEGSATVYMVVNNTLRPFTTPAIFHAKGKKFTNIQIITQDIFNKLGIGKPVGEGRDDDDTMITLPISSSLTSTTTLSNLPEGTLVKTPGNPTVYIVSGGVLKPFTSMTVLNTHKKDLNKIRQLTDAQLAALPLGSPATFADGTLLKGSGSTIYVVRGGQLYGIPSMEVLKKKALSLKNLLKVKDQELGELHQAGIED